MKTREIYNTLVEGISPILYHVTSLMGLRGIIKTDKFKLTPDLGTEADKELGHENKIYYFSTSRHKLGGYGLIAGNGQTSIVLDGRKLSQNYSGKPVDYWGHEFRKVDPKKGEAEDRIYSNDRYIPNATSYILEVHIFLEVDRPEDRPVAIRAWRETFIELKKQGVPYWLYDDKQAYLIQNKGKAIDLPTEPLRITNKDDLKQYSYQSSRRDYLKSWVELYFKNNIKDLSKDAKAMVGDLNYEYDAERLLMHLKNDFHNQKGDTGQGMTGVDSIIKIMQKHKLRTLDEFVKMLVQKWKSED